MIIPHERLETDTLYALIEEFVTRDGAVHGHHDTALAAKMESVLGLLRDGLAVIVFDEAEETCSVVLKKELPREP